ncbi:unnamed protein product [Mytilus coruscus]|uniref:Peptidase A2 domain-containing protein n=1 Tax=Mytilus coruscus TaxID=42192 RepID=A0A6J8DCR1_MYTCO|nr:unnamed protein product [Mytilus coruscus]
MYKAQMKSKIRGRTKQIPVLGQDIKRLVRLAYPSAPMEIKKQLARDCFVDSLNDADMEWAIFKAKAKSVNNAIQVAPSKMTDKSGSPNDWSGKLLVAETEDQVSAETKYDFEESNNFEKLSQIKSTNSDSLYEIVSVFDMILICLIDTGSTVNVLNSSMYNTMSKSVKPVLSNARSGLRMANGSVVMPMGTAVFPVQLNKKNVYHRLIVGDINISMFIEFDFLDKSSCILYMGKRL